MLTVHFLYEGLFSWSFHVWKVLSPRHLRGDHKKDEQIQELSGLREKEMRKPADKRFPTSPFQNLGEGSLVFEKLLEKKKANLAQAEVDGGEEVGGRGCEQRTKWLALQTAARCPAQEQKASFCWAG